MLNLVIFPVIFFFLHTSPPLTAEDYIENCDKRKLEIYLIKQYWHTAIVIDKNDIDPEILPEVEYFNDFSLLDFGWGDEEFYQHPGFDSGLAFKALFYATPSTLRVEGIGISKDTYFDISEIVVRILVTQEQLNKIVNFISTTLYRNNNGSPVILSEQGLGRVKFFKANGNYHLFNTCNTWLAKCLVSGGIEIIDDIILTEELFNEAAKIGNVIKVDE
ncbi:MAG: DUF2459 domain-containing protein [Bacteroidetes bacterium]|nr:DUF2459 domain-containing protein [Bacteroidota bacterium]